MAVGVLAASLFGASQAEACSRAEAALPPSNFESVMVADAVVLARAEAVESVQPAEGARYPELRARFVVLEEIAGAPVGPSVELHAIGIAPERSPADTFLAGRPSGNCSSCVCGYGFAPGLLYVLLLERSEQGWSVGGIQAARAAEQVDDARAPWVAAVREYARIARDPDPRARRRALEALRDRAARGEEPDAAPPALVEDLDDHFGRPHATKSFEELVALYEAAGEEGDARRALWALAFQDDARVDAHFETVIEGALRGEAWFVRGDASRLLPVVERAGRLKQVEAIESLVTLYEPLAGKESGVRFQIARSLRAICARAPSAWILAVAQQANDEELAALGGDPDGELCAPAVAEARRRVGEDYGNAYYGLRALLARAGDGGAALWADGQLDAGGEGGSVAAYLLAVSPGPEADAALRRRIEEAADGVLALLAPVLISEAVVDRDGRFAAIEARLASTTEPYPLLRAALAEWRHWGRGAPGWVERLLDVLDARAPRTD